VFPWTPRPLERFHDAFVCKNEKGNSHLHVTRLFLCVLRFWLKCAQHLHEHSSCVSEEEEEEEEAESEVHLVSSGAFSRRFSSPVLSPTSLQNTS